MEKETKETCILTDLRNLVEAGPVIAYMLGFSMARKVHDNFIEKEDSKPRYFEYKIL